MAVFELTGQDATTDHAFVSTAILGGPPIRQDRKMNESLFQITTRYYRNSTHGAQTTWLNPQNTDVRS